MAFPVSPTELMYTVDPSVILLSKYFSKKISWIQLQLRFFYRHRFSDNFSVWKIDKGSLLYYILVVHKSFLKYVSQFNWVAIQSIFMLWLLMYDWIYIPYSNHFLAPVILTHIEIYDGLSTDEVQLTKVNMCCRWSEMRVKRNHWKNVPYCSNAINKNER